MTPRHTFVWLAHILLGIGLAAPCMTVIPRFGDETEFARWLGLVDDPRTYSILTGIENLLRGDGLWIGLLLLCFSVLFPLFKLIALRVAIARPEGDRLQRALGTIGKFSMADVFVVALLVVASKSFPGGTEVRIEWGIYAFAAAAVLTTALSVTAPR
ncbi:MAG: paraquat-inducible protein A [Planctomycetota bacterium]